MGLSLQKPSCLYLHNPSGLLHMLIYLWMPGLLRVNKHSQFSLNLKMYTLLEILMQLGRTECNRNLAYQLANLSVFQHTDGSCNFRPSRFLV